jgi:DNA ligase 1
MTQIEKPMLASTLKSVNDLSWEHGYYMASPKIDGYRVLKVDGKLMSRRFNPVANLFINEKLSFLPDGIDGELIVGTEFGENGAIRRIKGEPDFTFHVFDYVLGSNQTKYETRAVDYGVWCFNLLLEEKKWVTPVPVKRVFNTLEIDAYEEKMLSLGYEGIMLRDPLGPYKFGRATAKEEYLMKVKRFEDAEAVIIGFDEMMNNNNVAERDAFGRSKRSSSIDGKDGAKTLGALVVKGVGDNNPFRDVVFNIGTGFSSELKQEIWDHRDDYRRKMVTYKYFSHGAKDAPRHPVFMRFREE